MVKCYGARTVTTDTVRDTPSVEMSWRQIQLELIVKHQEQSADAILISRIGLFVPTQRHYRNLSICERIGSPRAHAKTTRSKECNALVVSSGAFRT
jgi:hypothetical protein